MQAHSVIALELFTEQDRLQLPFFQCKLRPAAVFRIRAHRPSGTPKSSSGRLTYLKPHYGHGRRVWLCRFFVVVRCSLFVVRCSSKIIDRCASYSWASYLHRLRRSDLGTVLTRWPYISTDTVPLNVSPFLLPCLVFLCFLCFVFLSRS